MRSLRCWAIGFYLVRWPFKGVPDELADGIYNAGLVDPFILLVVKLVFSYLEPG